MRHQPLTYLLRAIRPLVGAAAGAERSDRELLERFARNHDEDAFRELLRRHGPMVLGVCRRVLQDAHAADDAFQATFLVLFRRAGTIHWGEVVGGWLYRVAYRTALKARAAAAQRQVREREAGHMHQSSETAADGEIQEVLDAELARLPAKYRLPIVLCCLEGRSKAEASQQLGWREGTLSSRLARARAVLRERLVRRGLAVAAGGPALATETLSGAVSTALQDATAQLVLATGGKSGGSAAVAALAGTVARELAAARLRLAALIFMAVGLIGGGAGVLVYRTLGGADPDAGLPTAAAEVSPAVAVAQAPRVDAFGDPLPDGALFRLGTVRLRHGQRVLHMAFVAGSKELLSGSEDGTVRMWDPATGKELRRFPLREPDYNSSFRYFDISPDGAILAANQKDHLAFFETATGKTVGRCDGPAHHFAFADDGKTLIGIYRNAVVHWEVPSGKKLREWSHGKDDGNFFYQCAFSADRRLLAIGDFDQKSPMIHLWDVNAGKLLHEWKAHESYVRCLAFSPDGKVLASGSADKTVRSWDVATTREISRVQAADEPWQLAFAPDGRTLAGLEINAGLVLWDRSSGAEARRFAGAAGTFTFAPDGRMLAAGDNDHGVRFWDIATGKAIDPLPLNPGKITRVAFVPGGRILASDGAGGNRLWDMATGKPLRSLAGNAGPLFSPDGKTAAVYTQESSAGNSGFAGWKLSWPKHSIRLFDAADGKERSAFRVTSRDRVVLGWSPDSRLLATADGWNGARESAALWETVTGKEFRRFEGRSVAMSPDLRTVAVVIENWGRVSSGAMDEDEGGGRAKPANGGELVLIDAATGQKLRRIPDYTFAAAYQSGEESGVRTFPPSFSPDGKILVTASGSGKRLSLWEAATGKELARLSGREFRPDPLCFSPDGQLLAVMDSDSALCILRPTTGKVLRRLPQEPPQEVRSCAFSADGRLLAASFPDRTVRLYELATGKEVGSWAGYTGDIHELQFAPDGRALATVISDGTAVMWDVTGRIRDGRLPPVTLKPEEMEAAWEDLGSTDAARAHRALWSLVAAAHQAVPLLTQHLRPTAPVDPQRLAQLVVDLRDERFEARQKATDELERLAELAEAALRKGLAGQPALDFRKRAERLLDLLDRPLQNDHRLRSIRGVAVLETLGTPAARQLLERLAGGAPDALVTREAKASLARLDRRLP